MHGVRVARTLTGIPPPVGATSTAHGKQKSLLTRGKRYLGSRRDAGGLGEGRGRNKYSYQQNKSRVHNALFLLFRSVLFRLAPGWLVS